MKSVIAWFERVERALLTALVASSILMSVIGVFYRYVLGRSLSFVEEIAGLIMAAVIVLGSSLAITTKEHIRVELLMKVFPKLVRLINCLAWLTWLFVAKLIANGQIASSVEWLKIGWPLLVVPAGYAVCCLKAFWILVHEVLGRGIPAVTELDELMADRDGQVAR
jgi:TRAP-type C4-dicarboxylate transport system permease small subunit